MTAPQCFDCTRLRRGEGMKCDAFPGGIPGPIQYGERDHREPFADDRGIRYDPIPGRPR